MGAPFEDAWRGSAAPDTLSTTSYTWWDSAQVGSTTFKPDVNQSTTYSSTYTHDASGRLASVAIADGRPRTVTFVNNALGQVIERDEADYLSNGDPRELSYFFEGVKLGATGNNGTDDVDYSTMSGRRETAPSGYNVNPFRNGTATSLEYADFDQSYDPLNGLDATGGSRHVVQEGDTLQGIAQAVWGDGSLWYMLAEANGLSGGAALTAGTSLIVPDRVTGAHNNASTFRPYDPSQAIGDLSPTNPKRSARPQIKSARA